jgi:hypothetical protein
MSRETPKLATRRKLTREWHPKKNGDKAPRDFTLGSSQRVWWQCEKGHEWQAQIRDRVGKNSRCPYCSGKRASHENNLHVHFPEIAKEWHPAKNVMQPTEILPFSSKKVWWRCEKSHDWIMTVAARSGGGGCPRCYHSRRGEIRQQVALRKNGNIQDTHPEIAKEWHPTKNGTLLPTIVSPGSGQKIWWKCKNGHVWKAGVQPRTYKNVGCPECAGTRVGKDNNLNTQFPAIAKEWHPTKNKPLKPTDVHFGSKKRVWWKCDVGEDHEWGVSIGDRTRYKTGCPFCDGKRVSETNSLASLDPDIATQWHPTKNEPKKPTDIPSGSSRKVWWLCENGHEWKAQIASRTGPQKRGCPDCHNVRKGALSRAASVRKGGNIVTTHPEIARQWDDEKNAALSPSDFPPGSNQKVWWKCDKGHSWPAIIVDRTGKGSGCPKCNPKVSKIQIQIYCELKTIFSGVTLAQKVASHECDILLAKHHIAVEYDGAWYHENRKHQDSKKNKALAKKGVKVIRIRETPLPRLGKGDLLIDASDSPLAIVQALLRILANTNNLSKVETSRIRKYLKRTNLAGEIEYRQLISTLPGPLPGTSLEELHPQLVLEWDKDRNDPLTPRLFTPGSGQAIWWSCKKGHSWETTITNRTQGHGCRTCSYEAIGLSKSRAAVVKQGSLSQNHPQIAKQWHPTKNEPLKASEVSSGSGRKAWWHCSKGHGWQASINDRTRKNTACPECVGRILNEENNLQVLYPHITVEWYSKKNKPLTPDQVHPGSHQKVWWQCAQGHSWLAQIKSRAKQNRGCPECAGRTVGKDNNLKVLFPDIAKQWHPRKNEPLKATDVTPGSGKKVWWICKRGHEWETTVNYRKRYPVCPQCNSGR